MSVLYILVGASITIAGAFLAAFIWSVKSGQYDDDYTPSVRMLFDQPARPADAELPGQEKKTPEKTNLPE